ncbi:MAG: hypothetical protein OEO23_09550 [Gemmatimonadota bacterium]|nr:hypothetical protein [Gemmatimonadota bacterium]
MQPRWTVAGLGILIVVACAETTVGPNSDDPSLTEAFSISEPRALSEAGQPTVEICHALGNGGWQLITVAEASSPGHDGHGDGVPQGNVPEMVGYRFDENCVPEARTISGTKFNDLDGNGTRDSGEPGLPAWRIFLDENGDGVLDWVDGDGDRMWDPGEGEQWTLTAADGSYSFEDLVPGTYSVWEELQHGWAQTLPGPPLFRYLVTLGVDRSEDLDFGNQEEG